jgi:hypothetical protein
MVAFQSMFVAVIGTNASFVTYLCLGGAIVNTAKMELRKRHDGIWLVKELPDLVMCLRILGDKNNFPKSSCKVITNGTEYVNDDVGMRFIKEGDNNTVMAFTDRNRENSFKFATGGANICALFGSSKVGVASIDRIIPRPGVLRICAYIDQRDIWVKAIS